MDREQWYVRVMGNVTMSVVDAGGEQILAVGLLRSVAMKAGDNGQALVRMKNNLAMLAMIPQLLAEPGLTMMPPTRPQRVRRFGGGWRPTRSVGGW